MLDMTDYKNTYQKAFALHKNKIDFNIKLAVKNHFINIKIQTI